MLARKYMNNYIHGTSTMALFRESMNLQEVANMMGHSSLESLKCYLERLSHNNHANASDALFHYAQPAAKMKEMESEMTDCEILHTTVKQIQTILSKCALRTSNPQLYKALSAKLVYPNGDVVQVGQKTYLKQLADE